MAYRDEGTKPSIFPGLLGALFVVGLIALGLAWGNGMFSPPKPKPAPVAVTTPAPKPTPTPSPTPSPTAKPKHHKK